MFLTSKILSKWFGNSRGLEKHATMEALEGRRFLSATLPVGTVVPPFHGPVPVVPMIKSVGVTIHAGAGQKFIGVVGEVENIGRTAVGASEISNLSKLQAVITWGDGSLISLGSLKLNSSGTVVISGSHRYANSGKDAVTVVLETKPPVVDPPTATILPLIIATVDSTAEVAGGRTLIETATQRFTAVVGYFRFGVEPTTTAKPGFIFETSIDWGDGSTGKGTLKEVSPGFYSITGTHTYKLVGDYKVHIGVTATPAPTGGVEEPIILLVASFDSTIDVKGHA